MSSDVTNVLHRDLYILEDENNPYGSRSDTIYPTTVLDQVFDDLSPTRKTLRTILTDLKQEIISGGKGNIVFPVTSVNGQTGDVVLTKDFVGLDKVDNTRDIDKPLSDPQRAAIMQILDGYDFHVDLTDLYNHLIRSDNPHNVTFDQINRNGAVRDYVIQLINQHNASLDTHRDIRESITQLQTNFIGMNDAVEAQIARALDVMSIHYRDTGAHATLFDKKENIANKATSFTDTDKSNHILYPSTRAVVEFVAGKMNEFRGEVANVQNWIDDIIIVDRREDLPPANFRSFRKAYFIRYGQNNNDEIAICRINPDGRTYAWDYSTFGTYSKFNPDHFVETDNGLSVNTRTIADILMSEDTIAERMKETLISVIPDVLGNYYTKDEIDNMHVVHDIKILPGTQHGSIRYYINNDQTTMTEDIHIPGLSRLAYLDHVTENEIHDQAVHSRHIANSAIESRHMSDKSVGANNMKASFGTLFGNVEDEGGNTVREISLDYLADLLDPRFHVIMENVDFLTIPEATILEMVDRAFKTSTGWINPTEPATIRLQGRDLVVEYDGDYKPKLYFNENGELILESEDTPVDKALERFSFEITPDNLLWMRYE